MHIMVVTKIGYHLMDIHVKNLAKSNGARRTEIITDSIGKKDGENWMDGQTRK